MSLLMSFNAICTVRNRNAFKFASVCADLLTYFPECKIVEYLLRLLFQVDLKFFDVYISWKFELQNKEDINDSYSTTVLLTSQIRLVRRFYYDTMALTGTSCKANYRVLVLCLFSCIHRTAV